MNAVTLTLNPAYDVHCYTESFAPHRENLVRLLSRDAGGKGINIARALLSVGVRSQNIVVVGEESRFDFESRLSAEGLACIPISTAGGIRENITLSEKNAPETRISFPGFSASDGLIDKVREKLFKMELDDTAVTFSGRLPEGISHGKMMELLFDLKKKGARLVLDSRALTGDDIIALSPWLIKPNEEEVASCFADADVRLGARRMHEAGVENVMVSLGARGAILVCSDGEFELRAPKIEVRSTVGAGDSSIAGFIFSSMKGMRGQELLRHAVAFGSAACLVDGTGAPKASEIERILKMI